MLRFIAVLLDHAHLSVLCSVFVLFGAECASARIAQVHRGDCLGISKLDGANYRSPRHYYNDDKLTHSGIPFKMFQNQTTPMNCERKASKLGFAIRRLTFLDPALQVVVGLQLLRNCYNKLMYFGIRLEGQLSVH